MRSLLSPWAAYRTLSSSSLHLLAMSSASALLRSPVLTSTEAATFPGSGSTASQPMSQKVKAAAENIKKKLGNVTYDNADDTGNDHRVDMYPQGHRSASRSRDRSAQGRQQRAGLADPDDYRVDTERVGRSTVPSGLRNESHNEHHHSHHHGETGELAGGQTVGGQGHHHRG